MKKSLLFNGLLLTAASLMLLAGCKKGEGAPAEGWEINPTVAIEVLPISNNSEVTVVFTPDDNVTEYKFAIGDINQLAEFVAGTLPSTTIKSNSPVEHIFSGLEKGVSYMVFARATDGKITGPVTSDIASTFKPDITVEEIFTGSKSLAMHAWFAADYTTIEYAITDSIDEVTDFSGAQRIYDMDPRGWAMTFFDLVPETEYYITLRAEDRFQEWTNPMVIKVATKAFDEVASVATAMGASDYFTTKWTYTPNDNVSQYMVCGYAGSLQPDQWEIRVYNGNYFMCFQEEYELNQNPVYTGEMNDYRLNETFDLNAGVEIYILIFDAGGNPAAVDRLRYSSPSYDSTAGIAEVDVQLVSPSAVGGSFSFTPNDATAGFIYESFTKSFLEGRDGDGIVKDDEWVKGYLTTNALAFAQAGQYQHRALAGLFFNDVEMTDDAYWSLKWTDKSAGDFPSGTEIVVYVMPLNKNGLYEGVGTLDSVTYQKL